MIAGLRLAVVTLGLVGAAPALATQWVDVSNQSVFGLRWWQPVVRTGMFRTVSASWGQPGIADDARMVVVATGEGRVLGLDLDSGREQWRVEFGTPFAAAVSIVREEGRGRELALLTSRSKRLLAFDAATGEKVWDRPFETLAETTATQTPKLILLPAADNQVYALSPATGEVQWSAGRARPAGLSVRGHAGVTLGPDGFFSSFSDGYVEAYDFEGSRRWSRPLSVLGGDFGDADADPVLAEGRLFAASYSDGLYALDPRNGQTQWIRDIRAITSLAYARGVVIVASADGHIWGLDPRDGARIYRTAIGRGPVSRLTVVEGWVAFSNGGTGFVVLEAATGKPLQASAVAERIDGNPGWSKDLTHTAVLSSGGRLFVFGRGVPPRVR